MCRGTRKQATSECSFNFDNPKIIFKRDLSKLALNTHPDFAGIHHCYHMAFRALRLTSHFRLASNKLNVWSIAGISNFWIADNFDLYLHHMKLPPSPQELHVYTFPSDANLQQQLKRYASFEFLSFLQANTFDIHNLNPQHLQQAINRYISTEVLLDFNRLHSFKAHKTLSLEGLGKLLNFSHTQLHNRNRKIHARRQHLLDEVSKQSKVVDHYLNQNDFSPNPTDFWNCSYARK